MRGAAIARRVLGFRPRPPIARSRPAQTFFSVCSISHALPALSPVPREWERKRPSSCCSISKEGQFHWRSCSHPQLVQNLRPCCWCSTVDTGDHSATSSYEVLKSGWENSRQLGWKPVAISVDSPDVSRELCKKAGYTFPILSDPNANVIRRYDLLHVGGGPEGHDIARPAEFLVAYQPGRALDQFH